MSITNSAGFVSWKEFHCNRSNASVLNQNADKITELTNPTIIAAVEAAWDRIRENSSQVYVARNIIGEEVMFTHFLTMIGGTIEEPTKHYVGLYDFGSKATPLEFDKSVLEDTVTFDVPSFDDFKTASTTDQFKALPAKRRLSRAFRPLIALPPFIVQAVLRDQSSKPEELGIITISATVSFMEAKKDDAAFDKDKIKEAGHLIASFFWGVSNEKIQKSPSAPASNPSIRRWAEEIHQKHIAPNGPTPPDPSQLAAPSEQTMASLASNLAQLTSYNMSRDQVLAKSEDEKKDKFKSWPESSKRMLLNSMTVDGKTPATEPTEVFKKLINQPTVSRVKQEIESLGRWTDVSATCL